MKRSSLHAPYATPRLRASVLRRMVPFLSGVLGGFFLAGPLCMAILVGLHAWHRLDLLPLPPGERLPLEGCDYSFLPRLAHAADAGALFLAGSSELQAPGDSPFAGLTTNGQRILPVGDKGPGFLRARVLIGRLRAYGRRAHGIIVVVNPHYATTANKKLYPVGAVFFDDDSLSLYDEDAEAGNPGANPIAQIFARLRVLQRCATSASTGFDRIVSAPLSSTGQESEPPARGNVPIDAGWGVPVTMVPDVLNIAPMREERRVPEHLAETEFGRYAAQFRAAAEASQTPVRVLVLPLHPLFTKSLGLDPDAGNASLARQIQEILGPSIQVVEIRELGKAALFRDSIHFTREGQEILARIIEREAGFFPAGNAH